MLKRMRKLIILPAICIIVVMTFASFLTVWGLLDTLHHTVLGRIAFVGLTSVIATVILLIVVVTRAAKPVAETMERNQLMLEESPVATFLFDLDDNALDCNYKAQEMFGFHNKNDALKHTQVILPLHQPNGEKTYDTIDALANKAIKIGVAFGRIMLQNRDETPIPTEITFVKVNYNGTIALAEYIVDLRKLRKAEEKLLETQKLERLLNDANPIPSTVWNSKYELIQANNAMVQFLGLSSRREVLERFLEFSPEIQPDGVPTKDKVIDNFKYIEEFGFHKTLWEHIIPETGETIPCEISMKRVDFKGDYYLVAYLHDLRSIRALEEKEREVEKLNKIILDSAPLTVNIRNVNNELLQVNQQFLDVFGIANKEQYMRDRLKLNPEFQPCGTETMEKNKENFDKIVTEGIAQYEWMYRTYDGEELPMEMLVVKTEHMNEDIFLAYGYDLRPMKKAIALADENKRKAELAMQETLAKTRFLAQISHEIRTPMNAVLGIVEIQLQNEDLSKDLKESLSHIRNSSYLLLAIINNLLDLSKAEAGKMEIVNNSYEAVNMIADTIQINMFYMGSKRIEFKINVDENLPVQLIGDELRIKQILNNLLSNAFKYTNEGSVELSIKIIHRDLAPLDQIELVIHVKDTGRGMTQAQIYQLFGEEYLRFNENDAVEGSGLGMIITYQLVKMMNGKIEVISEPQKGTEVILHIPQKTINNDVIGKEYSQKLQNFEISQIIQYQMADFVREAMPYGRVLIVDDVELNHYVAKGHLSPYHLKIDTAMSGFEAIDIIKQGNTYDIVFMDHMMPEMDGIETVRRMRDDGYEGIIVALTANALVGNVDIFIQHGFDDFLSKPIDISDLNRTLNKYIRDFHPEEAAKYSSLAKFETETIESTDGNNRSKEAYTKQGLDSKMIEVLLRDIEHAIVTLRETLETGNLKLFTISVHAMKSTMAYIGEAELSESAKELEQAGQNGDMLAVTSNAGQFIESLEVLLEKLQEIFPETDLKPLIEGNMETLTEKLKLVEAACDDFDVKIAIAAIDELLEHSWKPEIVENLQKIHDALFLDSDFDLAMEVLDDLRR